MFRLFRMTWFLGWYKDKLKSKQEVNKDSVTNWVNPCHPTNHFGVRDNDWKQQRETKIINDDCTVLFPVSFTRNIPRVADLAANNWRKYLDRDRIDCHLFSSAGLKRWLLIIRTWLSQIDRLTTCCDALFCVPPMTTITPRKMTTKWREQIEKTPSYNDIVVNWHKKWIYGWCPSESFEHSRHFECCSCATACELSERHFQEEKWSSD